jgi:hypothetical protein
MDNVSKLRRQIDFTIDGRPYTTTDHKQLAADVLRLGGLDPSQFDLGAPGGTTVTQLVYSGDLSAKNQQGHFGGSCVLVSPTAYQCEFIGDYPDGQLVHQGIVDATALTSPTPDFDLATTGGTGTYRGSHGEVRVHRTGSITEVRSRTGTQHNDDREGRHW